MKSIFDFPQWREFATKQLARALSEKGFTIQESDLTNSVAALESAMFSMVLTRQEAARFLSVSIRTIDRWQKHQGLPGHYRRLGPGKPRRVYMLPDLLEWHDQLLANL